MSEDRDLARDELRAALRKAHFKPAIKEIRFSEPAAVNLGEGIYTVAELRLIADWLEQRDKTPVLSREHHDD